MLMKKYVLLIQMVDLKFICFHYKIINFKKLLTFDQLEFISVLLDSDEVISIHECHGIVFDLEACPNIYLIDGILKMTFTHQL